jgi:hypothetical protein
VLTDHRHTIHTIQISIVIWAAFLEYLLFTILKEAFINSIHYSGTGCVKIVEYSGNSIYRFSRGWRKQTMNAGKRLIRETITPCK